MWSHPEVLAVTLRLRMVTDDSDRVRAAIEKLVAAAEEAGFEIEDAQTALSGGGEIRAGQSGGELGEDREVGLEPHPPDPPGAERR